eukprot:356956-Chlamydomonas_euryale.AAC.1
MLADCRMAPCREGSMLANGCMAPCTCHNGCNPSVHTSGRPSRMTSGATPLPQDPVRRPTHHAATAFLLVAGDVHRVRQVRAPGAGHLRD